MESRVEAARGKVNLGLFVIERRKDGFHEIRSVLHAVEIADILVFQPYPKKRITASRGPRGKNNLAYKALELLEEISHYPVNISVHIDKYIPIGGGMGGGSSDAATTMRTVCNSLALGLMEKDLLEPGIRLGSDVPFFLSGYKAAMASGRGELLTPLRTYLKAYLTIYTPGFPIDTKWAYDELDKIKGFTPLDEADERLEEVADCLIGGDAAGLAEVIGNDFEKVVFKRYPEIKEAKEELIRAGAEVASLTGSGSCVFGISNQPIDPNLPPERVIKSKIGIF